jgi:hypothetical protein
MKNTFKWLVFPNHLLMIVELHAQMLSPPRPSKKRPNKRNAYDSAFGKVADGKGVSAQIVIPAHIDALNAIPLRRTPNWSMKRPAKKTRNTLGAL